MVLFFLDFILKSILGKTDETPEEMLERFQKEEKIEAGLQYQ